MKKKKHPGQKLKDRANKGFKDYPIATIALYGPDDKRASKVVVGIVKKQDADPDKMKKWYSDKDDVRYSKKILQEILEFIAQNKVKRVVMTDGIIGCSHEEGIDYPVGEKCPECKFWSYRDKWSGEPIS